MKSNDSSLQKLTYQEALTYLDRLGHFGIHLGMERIKALLACLDHPEREVKTIHVTGTNGKGSVASLTAEMLLAAGLRVGKFTSPHLIKYNERITVNDQDISDDDLAEAVAVTAAAARAVVGRGECEQPTQFEILTAAAFWYFARQKLDYAVIEVGLGGLWDSTNVIIPVVSVITNIALEHTDRLGTTLEAIAEQKAGIIKPGVPVVTGAEGAALGPIKAISAANRSRLYIYRQDFTGRELESSMAEQTLQVKIKGGEEAEMGTAFEKTVTADTRTEPRRADYASIYKIHLAGKHQVMNTALAVMTVKLVAEQDGRITEAALHEGAARTSWPGRLELISAHPRVILDGAHNPNGAAALREALDKYYPGQKVYFVFGMMADKDMAQVIKLLIRPEDKVYALRADSGPRAAEADQLVQLIGSNAEACPEVAAAYTKALAAAGPEGLVCVCGSLYLVGTFKTWRQQEQAAADGKNRV